MGRRYSCAARRELDRCRPDSRRQPVRFLGPPPLVPQRNRARWNEPARDTWAGRLAEPSSVAGWPGKPITNDGIIGGGYAYVAVSPRQVIGPEGAELLRSDGRLWRRPGRWWRRTPGWPVIVFVAGNPDVPLLLRLVFWRRAGLWTPERRRPDDGHPRWVCLSAWGEAWDDAERIIAVEGAWGRWRRPQDPLLSSGWTYITVALSDIALLKDVFKAVFPEAVMKAGKAASSSASTTDSAPGHGG